MINRNLVKVAASALAISAAGLGFIAQQEGTELSAYLDPVGIPTICNGRTAGVRIGQRATFAQCRQYLLEDSGIAGSAIAKNVKPAITQGQYDALASFTYNVGAANLSRSTLLSKLNAGDCYGAAREFDRWVYAKGRKLPGLIKRRAAERAMFEPGCANE